MKSSEMKEETSETIKFKNVIDSINSEIKTDVRKELEGQKQFFFFPKSRSQLIHSRCLVYKLTESWLFLFLLPTAKLFSIYSQ